MYNLTMVIDYLTLKNNASVKTSPIPFRPPRLSPAITGIIQFFLPFILDRFVGKLSYQINPKSIQHLKAIKGERLLLLPNHPSLWDPWALMALSRELRQHFYYVAAREVFDSYLGLQGWLMQRLGCYSIVRGTADKEAFKTTRNILVENQGPLVIFVEGEISNQNDSLLPLEPGVIQQAFLALQDLYNKAHQSLQATPSLYICPVALKYIYNPEGLEAHIDASLKALEEATGISTEEQSLYHRTRLIGFQVLRDTARQFGYPLQEEDSLSQQLEELQDFILTKMEQVINLSTQVNMSYLDRVRRIRNTIDRIIKDAPDGETDYQQSLHRHQREVLKNFYLDLDRIVNFIAIYDGYLHPETSYERYIDVIRRLEKEVFGTYRFLHPRTVMIETLEPFDLKLGLDAFLQDKKKVSERITAEIERGLYQALTTM